jgi:hypothetical protein
MVWVVSLLLLAPPHVAHADDFVGVIRPLLTTQCLDCHNQTMHEGEIDLSRFDSSAAALADRAVWKRVFDVVEAGQMPLKDSGYRLTPGERQSLLNFSAALQSLPDPQLEALDPGKPVLRRLTRLEYNNTVRDLFQLPYDIFAFPERLPVGDKAYFLNATTTVGNVIRTSMREYGQKTDLLLPSAGLPGDNRAEYGFANRGDAMNMSPLLLEKYLELSAAIARSERLERESPVMSRLLGVELKGADRPAEPPVQVAASAFATIAPNGNVPAAAPGNERELKTFANELTFAAGENRGAVFDVPAAMANQTIPAEGGLLKVAVGQASITVNPGSDLWLVGFGTADESSGAQLLTNKARGQKSLELTFRLENGGDDNGVEKLGLCVLARWKERGPVAITAMLGNGDELTRRAEITDVNTFYTFEAPAGTYIRRLRIDGSDFSGDHVLVDDLAFILKRSTGSREQPAPKPVAVAPQPVARAAADPAPPLETRVREFLTRAYRRPATDQELSTALSQIAGEQRTGLDEATAIRLLVQTIITSPDFIFLAEPIVRDAPPVRPLNDHELAARLSYFLWATMPDDGLLAAAASGELASDDGLRRQVRRMLADRSRSREFSESFATQWLRLDQLYSAKPDPRLFKHFYAGPQGKSTLHAAMLTEALLLVETVLIEDRSALDLVDPDFTWLNSSLASLYGLDDAYNAARVIAGRSAGDKARLDANEWYRVTLPDRSRGGVLTMAGPLTLTSLPHRTSPVKRGAWLLETVFHRPPAEPKVAFVLEERPAAGPDPSTLTVRQRFEQHRNDPNCFSCHSRIDPPGFALEMFDGIGAFRSLDGTQPVDATGVWNGITFTGPAEFKQALRHRDKEFLRGFVEHLMSYALARPIEHFDMPAVAKIVEDSAAQGGRLSALIEGVAVSYPFRHTRNLPGDTQ